MSKAKNKKEQEEVSSVSEPIILDDRSCRDIAVIGSKEVSPEVIEPEVVKPGELPLHGEEAPKLEEGDPILEELKEQAKFCIDMNNDVEAMRAKVKEMLDAILVTMRRYSLPAVETTDSAGAKRFIQIRHAEKVEIK